MGNLHFQVLLGEEYDENWDYLLVLPSSVALKTQQGFTLVKRDAGDVDGQPLVCIGRPRPYKEN